MRACKECGRQTKRPKFCSNRCKDDYYNKWNPRGLHQYAPKGGYKKNLSDNIEDDFHPGDSYALGQSETIKQF